MTTIVCIPKFGTMVSDSQTTIESEAGGARKFNCEKLYKRDGAVIGTAGESAPGLIFVDWYGTARAKKGLPPKADLVTGEADFTCLVLKPDKTLWEFDRWCRGEHVLEEFYAVGSGAKAALGVLRAIARQRALVAADAELACEIACEIDPYSGGKIVTMAL